MRIGAGAGIAGMIITHTASHSRIGSRNELRHFDQVLDVGSTAALFRRCADCLYAANIAVRKNLLNGIIFAHI